MRFTLTHIFTILILAISSLTMTAYAHEGQDGHNHSHTNEAAQATESHEGHNHGADAVHTTNNATQPASHNTQHGEAGHDKKEGFDIKTVIMDHIGDDHYWHLFSHNDFHASLPLPCIVFNQGKLNVFMSSKFHHGHNAYKGMVLAHGKIYNIATPNLPETVEHVHVTEEMSKSAEGKEVKELVAEVNGQKAKLDTNGLYDFSITKNVLCLIISFIILIVIFTQIAKRYKNPNKAPTGLQNALEPIIIFVRDEIAKPMLGKNYNKYLPYLLTLFFFIWVNNLLGLIPGSANLTGNIATTAVLAILTWIITIVNSNGHWWKHMVSAPEGAPKLLVLLLAPIELISNLLIKPFALMIRLFANILAGHMVILCLISLIFIFGAMSKFIGWSVAPVSIAFTLFIYGIELIVAFIQAFIFTMLTALFVGEAQADHSHEHAESH